MKRLSPNAMVVSKSELDKYGWLFQLQLKRNPQMKRVYPERRRQQCQALLAKRVNQWVLRYHKHNNPAMLKYAAYVAELLAKQLKEAKP